MTKDSLIQTWNGLFDERLIEAFTEVDRERFMPPSAKGHAYDDMPFPIGHGQTISQPTTVMMMLDWLELEQGHTVLEIGAGSGYNAALMSRIAEKVYTVEYSEELAGSARENLAEEGITNVEIIKGDGGEGYPPGAPYDRIVATCACPHIPPPWLDQLKDDGFILAPVGGSSFQRMTRVWKDGRKEELGEFRFVPLRGKYGF